MIPRVDGRTMPNNATVPIPGTETWSFVASSAAITAGSASPVAENNPARAPGFVVKYSGSPGGLGGHRRRHLAGQLHAALLPDSDR
ncbi:hypothetical protein DV20_10360 [Amycolatopsis rifamycinica]|uniref:Uncharacterized protein n=1 Tax=Amycolatopsis rifamycinica TaxID=287986 RepID=A0A066U8Y0_9PSEU|nr:hypothetical protein DV20_10360 [Amycolatopsis rifamycinica]